MKSAADHYDQHLGPVYLWMLGDSDAALARARAEIDALDPPAPGFAVDLGAGPGFHSLALAERGYRVLALDTCRGLLDELDKRIASLPVRTARADLLGFQSLIEAPPDLILCMGDTLTHLPDPAAVDALLAAVAASLAPRGVFAATFRDYSIRLEGDARFIPVRSDDSRILTCFLEYGNGTVTVHDLLHEKSGGAWRLNASSYPKLVLEAGRVLERLEALGFDARREAGGAGMVRIVARRR
jgi:SAM-dependent methyltransferase